MSWQLPSMRSTYQRVSSGLPTKGEHTAYNQGVMASRPRTKIIACFVAVITSLALLLFQSHWSHAIVVSPRSKSELPIEYTGPYRHVELNSTLGFEKVFAINMAKRNDKRAEAAILGSLYNIDIDIAPGVVGSDVYKLEETPENKRIQNELGAHRAHTDLWTRIVNEGISSALIFEDDMDWDESLRDQLNRLQEPFATFLSSESQQPISIDAKDPWNSKSWDVLWLGSCSEGAWKGEHQGEYLTYTDPSLVGNGSAVHRKEVWNFLQELNVTYPEDDSLAHLRSRVIQRANYPMCTAGYVVSHKGAMKLLYEVIHGKWKAMDNRVGDLGRQRVVDAYSVVPPLFAQFSYNWRDRDSDIGRPDQLDWMSPHLPGEEGKSLSIKNSAKAGLRKALAAL